jgi:DNA-binding CsgD family transcriptional regulator/sugar-specific transcriptional regulator TrmB
VEGALESLSRLGLVSRSPGGGEEYIAAQPDAAIEVLILRQQERLETARLAAAELADLYRNSARHSSASVVEILQGREAVAQRFRQMLVTTRSNFLNIIKPPLVIDRDADTLGDQVANEAAMIARGVSFRLIYDPVVLADRAQLEDAWRSIEIGEQIRVTPRALCKLGISDSRVAIIPLRLAEVGSYAAVIHESALLDALIFLFERLWEESVPLNSAEVPSRHNPHVSDPSPTQRRLLELLTLGMQDEVIARQMGIALRTVRARVAELREHLHAESRFQLAYLAVAAGWIKLPENQAHATRTLGA